MIKKVTITGADRGVYPQQLADLSQEFPFVEWGILASRKQIDSPRFPGPAWLIELARIKQSYKELHLSLHLCGAYVREFLKGYAAFMHELPVKLFDRIQLNTHGEPHEWSAEPVINFIKNLPEKEFIFQYDNVNTDLLEIVAKSGVTNISALYDLSHGAGLLPNEWPRPLDYCNVGYAGGLGPRNLKDQIKKIESVVGDREIWIDMETHVRTMESFDIEKAKHCLEIVSRHLYENA